MAESEDMNEVRAARDDKYEEFTSVEIDRSDLDNKITETRDLEENTMAPREESKNTAQGELDAANQALTQCLEDNQQNADSCTTEQGEVNDK